MAKTQTVRTPTHKWFRGDSPLAIAIGRLQGSTLWLNRLDAAGAVVEKSVAYSQAWRLTNYGNGVEPEGMALAFIAMREAWRYQFGPDVPAPDRCEVHAAEVTSGKS